MDSLQQFKYVAVRPDGRRVKGHVGAADDARAFEQLRIEGLSPISLRPAKRTAKRSGRPQELGDRDAAEFLSSLAELLKAGADIRTALSILGARFEKATVKALCESLSADIAGGESLERSFQQAFARRHTFVAPMIAAGEAAGDLAGGLLRSSEIITSRLKLRDQLVSVLAYPCFVFLTAIAAVIVILLFIVPSIAPLAQEAGGEQPAALAILMIASEFVTANLMALVVASTVFFGGLVVLIRLGVLTNLTERIMLDGPARQTVGSLVFGSFALSLGSMLSAGAPISDALRLAVRSTSPAGARRRLEPVAIAIREGQTLSDALSVVRHFPPTIIRLVAVGEASNMVGQLLTRAGKLEEERALERIATAGRIAGPALIVLLGAMLGVLMGGLLSGVSQIGQAALG